MCARVNGIVIARVCCLLLFVWFYQKCEIFFAYTIWTSLLFNIFSLFLTHSFYFSVVVVDDDGDERLCVFHYHFRQCHSVHAFDEATRLAASCNFCKARGF